MATRHLGFSIAHLNIRGLVSKMDEIRLILINHQFKVLHISETFLSSAIDNQLLHIPNYSIIRRDRPGRHGGGVLSYIHSSINFTVLHDMEAILPEALAILISQKFCKPFITSVIY